MASIQEHLMTYDTIPIKTLCILLDDESRVSELGLTLEEWAAIKEEYSSKNPSREADELMIEYSSMVKSEVEELKCFALLEFLKNFRGNARMFFEATGVKFTGDVEVDVKRLTDEINKAAQKKKIHKARCEQLAKAWNTVLKKQSNGR